MEADTRQAVSQSVCLSEIESKSKSPRTPRPSNSKSVTASAAHHAIHFCLYSIVTSPRVPAHTGRACKMGNACCGPDPNQVVDFDARRAPSLDLGRRQSSGDTGASGAGAGSARSLNAAAAAASLPPPAERRTPRQSIPAVSVPMPANAAESAAASGAGSQSDSKALAAAPSAAAVDDALFDGDALKSMPFFEDLGAMLSPQNLRRLAQLFVRQHFAGGQRIIAEGQRDDSFHLIVSGAVRVSARATGDATIDLYDLAPSQWCVHCTMRTNF